MQGSYPRQFIGIVRNKIKTTLGTEAMVSMYMSPNTNLHRQKSLCQRGEMRGKDERGLFFPLLILSMGLSLRVQILVYYRIATDCIASHFTR